MKFSTAIAASMLAGLLSATPIEKPNSRDLDLRSATSWTNPKGGNVNIKFSEQKVSYGTKKPSDAVGEVGLKCDGDACLPSFTITTVGYRNSEGANAVGSIDVSTESNFPTWMKAGLVESLKKTMEQQQTSETEDTMDGTDCGDMPCPTTKYTYWKGPEVLHIDAGDGNFLQFAATPKLSGEGGESICTDLATTGSVLAGAVSAELGGAFTLGTLLCALL